MYLINPFFNLTFSNKNFLSNACVLDINSVIEHVCSTHTHTHTHTHTNKFAQLSKFSGTMKTLPENLFLVLFCSSLAENAPFKLKVNLKASRSSLCACAQSHKSYHSSLCSHAQSDNSYRSSLCSYAQSDKSYHSSPCAYAQSDKSYRSSLCSHEQSDKSYRSSPCSHALSLCTHQMGKRKDELLPKMEMLVACSSGIGNLIKHSLYI